MNEDRTYLLQDEPVDDSMAAALIDASQNMVGQHLYDSQQSDGQTLTLYEDDEMADGQIGYTLDISVDDDTPGSVTVRGDNRTRAPSYISTNHSQQDDPADEFGFSGTVPADDPVVNDLLVRYRRTG